MAPVQDEDLLEALFIQKQHRKIFFHINWKLPFAGTKFRRSRALLGASSNIPDTQGSQRIFLLPFISQGSRAQVKNQVQAV